MTTQRALIVILILSLAGLVAGLLAYPSLPEQVPSHWNAAGEVDGWMSRTAAVFLLPALGLGLGLFLLYLPNIDPLRANIEQFRGAYNGFGVGFVAFLLFVHILTLLAGLGVPFNMTTALIPALALLMFGIGLLLERARPNWFAGIRTPWTLSSPTVWDKTHRLGSRLYKLSSALILLGLALPPETAFLLIMVLVLGVSLVTVVYSYIAYRAEQKPGG